MSTPQSANLPPSYRYRIIELIATGGMAEVYRAESIGAAGFRRNVAIKRVLPELVTDTKFIHMLLDEARLGARLNHSNCVGVVDVGRAWDERLQRDRYFVVMEYVDGTSLRALEQELRETQRPFPIPVAAFILREVCQGLHYAHTLADEAGNPLHVVHRDVSPANVLVSRHGAVKLADFGLAKAASHAAASEANIVKGKFSYLAPETVRQQSLDGRADVFAAGAVLWELVAGQKLYLGETPAHTIALVEKAEYRPLRALRPDVDQELDDLVAAAVTREPEQRPTAEEMVRYLSRWLARGRHEVCTLDVAKLVADHLGNQPSSVTLPHESDDATEARHQCENLRSAFGPESIASAPPSRPSGLLTVSLTEGTAAVTLAPVLVGNRRLSARHLLVAAVLLGSTVLVALVLGIVGLFV